MAQYACEICGAEFDTLSEYRRHMQTSHPERAPSAADLERALAGIDYPAPPGRLADHARRRGAPEAAEILESLPDREYRDAAEVARAFGEIRAHREKPTHQPSVRGGEAALDTGAVSAARLAQLCDGMSFPASTGDLKAHARSQASQAEMEVISRLPERSFADMSDVAKAFGEAKAQDRG
ncbi:MAG: DUF2795 domain-containing protein [Rhodosalinus sp.]